MKKKRGLNDWAHRFGYIRFLEGNYYWPPQTREKDPLTPIGSPSLLLTPTQPISALDSNQCCPSLSLQTPVLHERPPLAQPPYCRHTIIAPPHVCANQ